MLKVKFLAFVALLIMGLSAGVAPSSADVIDDIKARGSLRIPGILNEDPYFRKDPQTGEWSGFVIEMARDIAATLDVKLEVVESSWANAILDVQSGKVDLALASAPLPTRAMAVYFTYPIFYNKVVIVSPKQDFENLTWSQMNDPKFTYAVDIGSNSDIISQQYLGKANVQRFRTRDEAILAVTSGRADALINTALNGLVLSKKAAGLGKMYIPTPVMSAPSAIAVPYEADERWKKFLSVWAEHNLRLGKTQIIILDSMSPFGVTTDDLPPQFSFGG